MTNSLKPRGRSSLLLAAVIALMAILGPRAKAQAPIPDDLQAGYAAYKSGQFQEAANAFSRAINQAGLDRDALAVTLNNRGVAYAQLGRLDAAIADYLQAQKLKADDPTTTRNLRFAYLTRGLAYAKQSDPHKALEDYDRALAIDPDYVEALQYRGALQVELGATEAAAADFKRVLALEPDNPTAVAALAALQGGAPVTAPDLATTQAASASQSNTGKGAGEGSAARAQAALDDALQAATGQQPAAGSSQTSPPGGADNARARQPDVAGSSDKASASTPAKVPLDQPYEGAAGKTEAANAQVKDPADITAPADEAASETAAPSNALRRFRVNTAVNVRAGPANSFKVVSSLAADMVVTSDSDKLGWYRVRQGGRTLGWVYRRFLDPVQ